MSFVEKLKDAANRYIDRMELNDIEYRVKLVMREREELKAWTDRELKLATLAFRDDLKKGKPLDTLLVPAFAVANEAARRVLGKMPYAVQILAGIIIHKGKVAEMKAGEGKTLMETMPVYLNALEGKGVHLVTTNDYLAERDATEMGKLYDFLGLSASYVTSSMKNEEHRKAYAADVTYVSNQEIGFDYLRDNLVYRRADRVLRADHPLRFGIVDEIDSILIDESRTPLIIAEPVKEQRNEYDLFTGIVGRLEEEKDYVVDYVHKTAAMTNAGLDHAERLLGSPLFSENNPMYVFYLDVCLRAKTLFEKDRDYIVTPDGVQIVDEFTGRVLPGRRFTDGVHQAIEAKERVKVKGADRTQASVTFQNFFPMYEKLSGMSGTVMRARDEFNQVYKLDVVQIPTNRPIVRVDHNDLFFKTEKGKFLGLIKKVRQIRQRGQPLLIGARNVETAHAVSDILNGENLPHQLLTAADNRAEAEKIARGGQAGMITVATNMAGRGTDILLGTGVEQAGGLYVLGTERHESRRIDDQLIGRSGRQGEPGESQFLISMEDEIMQLFGSEKIIDVMENLDMAEDEYISGRGLDEAFKRAQDFVESKNLDGRLYLYKYDSVTSFQRGTVYHLRDSLLENPENFMEFLHQCVTGEVERIFALNDVKLVKLGFLDIFFIELDESELAGLFKAPAAQNRAKQAALESARAKTADYLWQRAQKIKDDPEVFGASQSLVLQIIDDHWSDQLELMDTLKEEAGLFSYASEDPLIDFILEGNRLFDHMKRDISSRLAKSIFLYLNQHGI